MLLSKYDHIFFGFSRGVYMITRTRHQYKTSKMMGVVEFHTFPKKEEHTHSAHPPQEGMSRTHILRIKIDCRFRSHSVFPNQLCMLRKLHIRDSNKWSAYRLCRSSSLYIWRRRSSSMVMIVSFDYILHSIAPNDFRCHSSCLGTSTAEHSSFLWRYGFCQK